MLAEESQAAFSAFIGGVSLLLTPTSQNGYKHHCVKENVTVRKGVLADSYNQKLGKRKQITISKAYLKSKVPINMRCSGIQLFAFMFSVAHLHGHDAYVPVLSFFGLNLLNFLQS